MSECDKYQEMISQMLDGELPEPHKTELVKHLGYCPDCRRVYDAFSAISLSLGETAAPEGFAGDVMAAVRTQGVHGSGRSKAPGKSLARYLALAACLVLAVLATVRLALPSGVRTDGAGAVCPDSGRQSQPYCCQYGQDQAGGKGQVAGQALSGRFGPPRPVYALGAHGGHDVPGEALGRGRLPK